VDWFDRVKRTKLVAIKNTAYTTLRVRRALLGREVLKKTGSLYKPFNRLEIELDS